MRALDLGDGVHAVEFTTENGDGAACFILTGEAPVLLDAGLSKTPERRIATALAGLGLKPDDLAGVFLSHAHHDHMNGARHCQTKWGLEVAGLGTARGRFETPAARWPEFAAGIELARPEFREGIGAVSPGTCKINREMLANERIRLGDHEWRVLVLPGHCRSLVGFFEERTGVLIAFDALQIEGNGQGIPIIEDFDAYVGSLRTISDIRPSKLICSHPFKPFGRLVLSGEDVDAALTAALHATDKLAKTFQDATKATHPASYQAFCTALNAPADDPLTGLTWSSLAERLPEAASQPEKEIKSRNQAIKIPTGGNL